MANPVLTFPGLAREVRLYGAGGFERRRGQLVTNPVRDDDAEAREGEALLYVQPPDVAPDAVRIGEEWYAVLSRQPTAGPAGGALDIRSERLALRRLDPLDAGDRERIARIGGEQVVAYEARRPFLTAAMIGVERTRFASQVVDPRIEEASLPAQLTDATYGYTEFVVLDEDATPAHVGNMIEGGAGAAAFRFDYSGICTFSQGGGPAWGGDAHIFVMWLAARHKANPAKGLDRDIITHRVVTPVSLVGAVGLAPRITHSLSDFSGSARLARDVDGTIGFEVRLGVAVWATNQPNAITRAGQFVHNLHARGDPRQPPQATTVRGSAIAALPPANERPLRGIGVECMLSNAEALFWQPSAAR